LYRLFASFAEIGQENIIAVDVVLGVTSFFVVAFGGVIIGIIFGIIASVTTKYTEKTPVLEPLIIITFAYLSYLTAEMTSTSSILA
jgi:sodium/hydrogen exchanger-like protein 3